MTKLTLKGKAQINPEEAHLTESVCSHYLFCITKPLTSDVWFCVDGVEYILDHAVKICLLWFDYANKNL